MMPLYKVCHFCTDEQMAGWRIGSIVFLLVWSKGFSLTKSLAVLILLLILLLICYIVKIPDLQVDVFSSILLVCF